MTKKLISIFFTLLFIFSFILLFKHRDKVISFINNKIYDNKESEIVITDGNQYERDYEFESFDSLDKVSVYNKDDIVNLFYTILNKGFNEYTFYCPSDYEECANDVMEITNDSELLSVINNYLSPFNSYETFHTTITNDREVYVQIEKLYSDDERNRLEGKISDIIKKLNIETDNYSTEDIKKYHDYLIENITYDEEYSMDDGITPSSKATGALLNGKSVCGGYADSFAIMLDVLKIPNFKVLSAEHVWNAVYIDNEWKHVDVTWDDDENNPDNTSNFYMITTERLMELDTEEHDYSFFEYSELK